MKTEPSADTLAHNFVVVDRQTEEPSGQVTVQFSSNFNKEGMIFFTIRKVYFLLLLKTLVANN